MRYQLAIFDMDGTILDTIDDLADSMNRCLAAHNMKQHTVNEVKSFVGNGIHKLVERAVPAGTPDETIETIFREFMAYYKDHCAVKTKPYAGIVDTILKLREAGVKTAVVSNKVDGAVHSLCRDYFEGLFDYEVGDKEGLRRKPYPDSVNEVLIKLGIPRAGAVYIGDSEVDYQTAVNSEMDVIMVSWGFREREMIEKLGSSMIADEPAQISEYILG